MGFESENLLFGLFRLVCCSCCHSQVASTPPRFTPDKQKRHRMKWTSSLISEKRKKGKKERGFQQQSLKSSFFEKCRSINVQNVKWLLYAHG